MARLINQYSRISHHTLTTTGTTAFSVPLSEDFSDGSWTPTDLALSEIGVKEGTDQAFLRIGNTIHEFMFIDSNTTFEKTYAELVNEVASSGLTGGASYLMTDFQTIYDRPDYSGSSVTRAPVILTVTAATEPLVLRAISETQFDPRVVSTLFPDDIIHYEFDYNTTFINSAPAKGRIIYRKDSNGNITDYDHRNITFKRYDRSGSGVYIYTWNSGSDNSSLISPIQIANSFNVTFGDCVKYLEYPLNPDYGFGFNLPNNIIGSDSANVTFGSFVKDNTFGTNYESCTFGNYYWANIFGNNYAYTSFANYYAFNIFGNNHNSNSFGNSYISNSFGNTYQNNNFGNSYSSNQFGNTYRSNQFGNNYITNIFGNTYNYNNYNNNYDNNNFGNTYQDNNFGSNYIVNIFGNLYSKNTFGNTYNDNDFGYQLRWNNFGNDYTTNDFISTNSGATFVHNSFGHRYEDNSFSGNTENCTIGSYFQRNSISSTFKSNNIVSAFYDNIITSGVTQLDCNVDGGPIGVDFSSATVIYQPYYKKFLKTSDGNIKLWTIDDTGVSTMNNPTA